MKQEKHTLTRLSDSEASAFSGQFHLILKSGISAIEGLQIMLEDAQDPDEKALLSSLGEGMMENGSLAQSMEDTGAFPSYLVHMVRIGEETGTLDSVMGALEKHYDRESSVKKNIRSSITYPLIMTGMMVIVILVLLVKVLPIFNQVFIQLGSEMTGLSRVLMNMGTAISNYAIVLVILFVLLIVFIIYGTRSSSGRKLLSSIASHIGFIRRLHEKTAACRFAGGMFLTLSSGLSPERSLELVTDLNEDPVFAGKLDSCTRQIQEGKDLSLALHDTGIFTGVYARMASIGSKTGSLDQVMDQIADQYQDEIDTRINNLLSVLEPTLVILLSLTVGMILLSVMLPLMGIMSSL